MPVSYPPITTYPYFTHIATILKAYEAIDEWLYNNHILLWIIKDKNSLEYWADFKYESEKELCPLLDQKTISRVDINREYYSVWDFITESIQNKFYLYLNTDMYYISEYWGNTNPHHGTHEILVYGFDADKKTVCVSDFFNTNGMLKYQFKEISAVDFIKAYKSSILDKDGADHLGGVVLLSYRDIEYNIDIKRIKGLADDFVKSADTAITSSWDIFENNIAYGVEYFDVLVKYIDSRKVEKDFIDNRPFYILYVLNSIMVKRIQYLVDRDYINSDCSKLKQKFEDIETEAFILKNLVFKYSLTRDLRILDKLKSRLTQLQTDQIDVFREFLLII